jgi:hypothetical protein
MGIVGSRGAKRFSEKEKGEGCSDKDFFQGIRELVSDKDSVHRQRMSIDTYPAVRELPRNILPILCPSLICECKMPALKVGVLFFG